jgi:hypothetical protein
MRRLVPGILVASLLATCDTSSPPAPPDGRSCQSEQLFAVPVRLALDMLLVVDESPAMAPYQEALGANLELFGRVLENLSGGLPDVHIAIVSADPLHAGVFHARAGCGLHAGESFISDVFDDATDARVRNYDGAIGDVLACLGTLGAGGSPTAAPLASMKAALDGRHAANADFHDRRHYLVVDFLGAQDDCSGAAPPADPLACAAQGVRCSGQTPGAPGTYVDCVPASGAGVDAIAPYEAFLDTLTDDPNLIVLGVVAAPGRPFVVGEDGALASSCSDANEGALPAVRLEAFAASRSGGTFQPICSNDWTGVLQGVAAQLATTLAAPCLAAVAVTDLAPDEPGLQPECSVVDVLRPGTDLAEETVIARCPMLDDATPDPAGVRPCWWVHPDPTCQALVSSGPWLEVERAPGGQPPPGTYVDARCLSCDPPAP